METDPRRYIAALRASHDRLAALVGELDDDDLDRQSMSTEWSVARVLGHLGSGAEIALANLTAHLAGVQPPGNEANPPIWERWNAMAPREAAEHFVGSDRHLVEAFEQLDDEQLDSMQIKLPFLPGPVDVATAVGFRLNEHMLHSWDVFATFDPAARLAAESVDVQIDRLPSMVGFIGRFTPRETRPPDPVTISVETSEPERRFELELGDDLDLRDSSGGRATVGELVLPAEALLRLAAGRLRADRASGDVEPTDGVTLAELRRAFPGY
jgi:uncharacterized protein (TIGR03083 family)